MTLCYGMRTEPLFWGKNKRPNLPIGESYFLVPFENTWSHVSLLFKMLVWLDFLLCPFCFSKKKNAFFWGKENAVRFVFCAIIYCFYKVQPVDGFSSFRWGTLCVSARSPLLGKRILSDRHLSLKHKFYMTCILHLPELCQPHERGLFALCSNLATYSILLLTRLMAQSLGQIYRRKNHPGWMTDACNQLQWAWTGGNYWIVLLMFSVELIKNCFYSCYSL